ncbi:MAG: hypothetical protein ACKOPQ_01335 [Novosphingobium sp.]|jgi:hypothetical protein
MSLRFAPSRNANDAILARIFARKGPARPVNDNGIPIGDLMADPQIMRETLMHLAQFGMGAAPQARSRALSAFDAGDETEGRRWLAICRQLDRRMARTLEKQQARRPA